MPVIRSNIAKPRQLRKLLASYDESELSEMLLALADGGNAVKDMDVLICLVPEIMKRFAELGLLGVNIDPKYGGGGMNHAISPAMAAWAPVRTVRPLAPPR